VAGRVKPLRWIAVDMLEAERLFSRVDGYGTCICSSEMVARELPSVDTFLLDIRSGGWDLAPSGPAGASSGG
jgi:hypothetical protein